MHLFGDSSDGRLVDFADGSAGVLVASGNEGATKETRADRVNLYLSRDAGLSWKKILAGPQRSAFGNYGGLLVAVSSSSASKVISYSWNLGDDWVSCEAFAEVMDIEQIVPVGGSGGLTFLVIGSVDVAGTNQGKIVLLDFSSSGTRSCRFYSQIHCSVLTLCRRWTELPRRGKQ